MPKTRQVSHPVFLAHLLLIDKANRAWVISRANHKEWFGWHVYRLICQEHLYTFLLMPPLPTNFFSFLEYSSVVTALG